MATQSNSPIPLFLASDSGCQHGMVVTIESALDAASADFRVELHIGDCGLDPEVRSSMEQVWAKHPKVSSIHFHRLSLEGFQEYMHTGLHAAALARLMITDLIPDHDRAIYLDTDILVHGDLKELAEVDLQGNALAGVLEGYYHSLRESGYKLAEIPLEVQPDAPYFNSGMMVIDLEKWRQAPVWDTGKLLMTQYRDKFGHNDQSVLNLLFSGKALMLPLHWNRQRQMFDELPMVLPKDGITHFIGGIKPWHFAYRPGCGAVSKWHEYLIQTQVSLPPLPTPKRSYRGPVSLLWARKYAGAFLKRLRSTLPLST